jgi:hypothetical protein
LRRIGPMFVFNQGGRGSVLLGTPARGGRNRWRGADRVRADGDGAAMDRIENTIGKGIVAGFVATFALSILLDPIALVARTVWPASPAVGWVLHFFVGTVLWGVAFAVLHDYLPGPSWQRGLLFALGAWVLLMGGGLVLNEARVLVFDLAPSIVAATFVVHILYGVSLGVIYGWLLDRDGAPAPSEPHDDKPLHPFAR